VALVWISSIGMHMGSIGSVGMDGIGMGGIGMGGIGMARAIGMADIALAWAALWHG